MGTRDPVERVNKRRFVGQEVAICWMGREGKVFTLVFITLSSADYTESPTERGDLFRAVR